MYPKKKYTIKIQGCEVLLSKNDDYASRQDATIPIHPHILAFGWRVPLHPSLYCIQYFHSIKMYSHFLHFNGLFSFDLTSTNVDLSDPYQWIMHVTLTQSWCCWCYLFSLFARCFISKHWSQLDKSWKDTVSDKCLHFAAGAFCWFS